MSGAALADFSMPEEMLPARERVARVFLDAIAPPPRNQATIPGKMAAEKSFGEFVRQAWRVIEPVTPFVSGWHIEAIEKHLEAVAAGKIRRLIINVPPRTGKSLLTSVFWPVWVWTRNPASRWLFVSYDGHLATKHSVDRRTVIQSPWYQERWGDTVRLASDQNMKTEFQNTARGIMHASGIGAGLRGRGGNFLVMDDPSDPNAYLTETEQRRVIDFYRYKFSTRLDNPAHGAVVLIMQRLDAMDLTGYLLKTEPGVWDLLKLPMEYEERA